MSDVPISSEYLACLICGCMLQNRSGVRTHMLRKHNRLRASTAAPASGSEERVQGGVVSRNGEDLEDAAGAGDVGDDNCDAPEVAPVSAAFEERSGPGGALRDLAVLAVGGAHPAASVRALDDQGQRGVAEDAAVHAGVDREMEFHDMLAPVVDVPHPPTKTRRTGSGVAAAEQEQRYSTIATEVRALYESMKDWPRSVPLIAKRKAWQAHRFNSYRLRALERFTLECGGSGLTLEDQERLYNLLDVWDGTDPDMPIDDGHNTQLRETFHTCNAFKNAVRDDVDDAVLEAGWRKVVLKERGMELVAYFRSALDVVLRALRKAGEIMHWSGGGQPAPATAVRESVMDGDAFRRNEEIVVNEHGQNCFVAGLHVFSDASHVSWSGGTSA